MNKDTQDTGPIGISTRNRRRNQVLALSAGGISIAMASVLSLVKLFEMPQGGSVTPASMLPIILYALCFGPVWGIGAGLVYGFIQFAIEPWFLSPVQMLLDYFAAFGLLGLAGLFAEKSSVRLNRGSLVKRLGALPSWRVSLAAIIGIAGRLAAAFVAGVAFYAEYAPEGQSPALYSLIYNGSYLLPEVVITIGILIAMGAIFRKSFLPGWNFLVAAVFPPAGMVLGLKQISKGGEGPISEGRWLTIYSILFLVLWAIGLILVIAI